MRFCLNGPLRHGLLNGDPHPGNCLVCPDGRVAFVDFGFAKRLTRDDVRQLVATTRATHAGDAQALLAVVAELGALPPDPALAEPFLRRYQGIFGWLLAPGAHAVDPRDTAAMMREYHGLRGTDGFEELVLPAEHFVLIRAVFLLLGLLGQLGARNPWLDIAVGVALRRGAGDRARAPGGRVLRRPRAHPERGGGMSPAPFVVPPAIAALGPEAAAAALRLVEEAERRQDREAAAALDTALAIVPWPARGVVKKVLLG